MEPLTLRLASEDETRALGIRLAAALRPGDFVGLAGELGAGKTVLARALCEALGVPRAEISSPTFAIINAYEGRVPVLHADLYRIESDDELHGTGLPDLVGGPSVVVVEWIERAPSLVPADALTIALTHVSEAERQARVEGRGPRGAVLREACRA